MAQVLKVFAVRDEKGEFFGPPFVSTNVGTAMRTVQEVLGGGKGPWVQFPEDFVLFEVGTYDESTGELRPRAGGVVMVAPMKELMTVTDRG